MSQAFTGKGLDRVDARLKVTGKATYAAEVAVANVAHAVIVTSAIAKGKITRIDTRAAEAVPGVLAVLTHTNAPKLPGADHKGKSGVDRVLQILQDDQVRYSDQPVALVVALDLDRARYAAGLVEVRYDASPPSSSMEAELKDAFEPPKAGPAGHTASSRGDADKALASAAVKVDETYTTPVENHNPMEMHATIAVWQGDDRVTVYDSTQGIFEVRRKISDVFGVPKENVRVISQFVGGGFGCKGSTWSHVALATMAARVVGRPVKLMVTRQQMFSLVGHRPQTLQRVALGADRSGKLVAVVHESTSESSRFDDFVEPCAVATRMLYACPNARTAHRVVRLDVPTPTFMRAPGESSGTFALESAMDELAYALRMDPLELRLRNHADSDPEEHKPWSSKSLKEAYRRGAERFGWAKRPAAVRATREGHRLVGWGMATATYPARQIPSSAIARMRADGTALVQAGTQDIGTGTYTIMTQIAADALAMPIERVRFELGDTTFPETPVSGGSMTASSTGSAVKGAGLELVGMLARLATQDPRSPLHGYAPDALDAALGVLSVRSDPSKKDAFADIVGRSGQAEIAAHFDAKPKEDRKGFSCHSFGADFVEVKVDEDLGEVRVTRVVGAFGAGKILNAKTAMNQFHGGLIWGIGLALLEHTRRDERSGRVVTRDLADYHVPVNADVPPIEVIMIDEDDAHVNEIGAKGIGEIGITGVGAAIANAVYHATGKRVRDLPITLDKLIEG